MKLNNFFHKVVPDFLAFSIIAIFAYIPIWFNFTDFASEQVLSGVDASVVFPVHGSDSAGYVSLSEGLINHGVLSHSTRAPYELDTFRTPGYPLMLAAFKALSGSYQFFPFIQILLAVFTSLMILRIGESLWGRAVGILASMMYLLDPTTIFHSLVLLSDIPFVFFIVLSIYLGFFAYYEQSSFIKIVMTAALSGVVLGFSVLVRPIAMFLPPLFLFFYFVFNRRRLPMRTIFVSLVFFIFGLSLLVCPWLVRNKIVANTWSLSSVAAFNLFHYYVPEFLAYKEHVTPDTIRLRMQADLPEGIPTYGIASVKNSSVINKISSEYLKGNFISYSIFHVVKTIPVFLSSGIKHVLFYYNDSIKYQAYTLNTGNMTTLLLQGRIAELLREVKVSFAPTLESLYLLLVSLLALVPVIFSKTKRIFTGLFFVLVAYFSLLTGSVAYARFRLPVAPFLFLLAAFGATIVWRVIRQSALYEKTFNHYSRL